MKGIIELNASLLANNTKENMKNYTVIKDSLNKMGERALTLTGNWQGVAKDNYINVLNEHLLTIGECLTKTGELIDDINTLSISLKSTQLKVNELVGGLNSI